MTDRSQRPGFGKDWSRYGFSCALSKRLGQWRVGRDLMSYGTVKTLGERRVRGLLEDAIREESLDVSCWLFDELHVRTGSLDACWEAVWDAVSEMTDGSAVTALRNLLRCVKGRRHALGKRDGDARANYLLGRLHLEDARADLRKRDQRAFSKDRETALRHLEKARDLAKAQPASGGEADTSTPEPLSLIGLQLEQAMYLKWVAPRSARKKGKKKSSSSGFAGGE